MATILFLERGKKLKTKQRPYVNRSHLVDDIVSLMLKMISTFPLLKNITWVMAKHHLGKRKGEKEKGVGGLKRGTGNLIKRGEGGEVRARKGAAARAVAQQQVSACAPSLV